MKKGMQNLLKMQSDGILVKDEVASFYVYRLTMDGRQQTGIVGCCDCEEYYDPHKKT